MRLNDDLANPRLIFLKGWAFLLVGILASAELLLLHPEVTTAILLAVVAWSFCRWYYFMFYVVEKYVDGRFRFAGLGSFIRYLSKKNAP